MVDLEKIILFIVLSTAVCAAPGPTVFFTLSNGITGDRKKAVVGIFGTVSANIVWVSCCSIGVATLIRDSQVLFQTLKYAGAVYLFYLGILSIRNKSVAEQTANKKRGTTFISVYFQGFLTSITNPKALLYYMSFFPQFVSGHVSYVLEIFFLGICYICVIFVVLGTYAFTSDKVSSLFKTQKFSRIAHIAIGIGFIGASVSVIRSK